MAEPNSYEEQRRRQMEENKRKLNELRLHRLSAAVREVAVKPMPAEELKLRYIRPPPPPPLTRRSGRVASLPKQPDYRDLMNNTRRRELPPAPVYATDEARTYAFIKAKKLKDQLRADQPSFIKPVSNYSATRGLCCIRSQFNKRYLPWSDEMIFLVDEEDVKFQMLYLAKSGVIGAGWALFAVGHRLADGDCLVFQLVQRTTFKVYIIRASSYYEKDHC